MKKLFALLLAICTLLCCALPVYALTEEDIDAIIDPNSPSYDQMIYAASKLGYFEEGMMNAPQLTLVNTNGEYRIDCTYIPEYYVSYFYNNKYHKITNETMQINVKLRIDNGEWVSDLWGPLSVIFQRHFKFDKILQEPTTFTIIDLQNINEDLPEGPYSDIIEIKDGKYFIDLQKHTLEVYLEILYDFNGHLYTMPFTPSSKVLELTENTIPEHLPCPVVDRVYASTNQNTISGKVAPNEVMNGLKALNHECYILMRYKLNDGKYSDEQQIACTNVEYVTFNTKKLRLSNDEENPDVLTVEFAYYDATQDKQSEWASYVAIIQAEPDALAQPPLQITPQPTAPKCGLCKQCSRPLNICVWCLIPGCALILIAITGVIICITKGKRNNTNKENKHA